MPRRRFERPLAGVAIRGVPPPPGARRLAAQAFVMRGLRLGRAPLKTPRWSVLQMLESSPVLVHDLPWGWVLFGLLGLVERWWALQDSRFRFAKSTAPRLRVPPVGLRTVRRTVLLTASDLTGSSPGMASGMMVPGCRERRSAGGPCRTRTCNQGIMSPLLRH